METIYDHNPTDEELISITGSVRSLEDYSAMDQQTETGRIYRLYKLRGDSVNAALYLSQITDPLYRRDISTRDVRFTS